MTPEPALHTCLVCGRCAPWEQLQFLGYQQLNDDGLRLELRNCPCGGTHAREEPPMQPDPLQKLLTTLPTYPGMAQVSIYDLPAPVFPKPGKKR